MYRDRSSFFTGVSERKFLLFAYVFLAIAFLFAMGQNVIRYGASAHYRPMRSVLYLTISMLLFMPLLPVANSIARKWLLRQPRYYWLGAIALIFAGLGIFYFYSSIGMYIYGFYDELVSLAYARSYFGREAFWHLLILVLGMVFVWHNRSIGTATKMISGSLGRKKVTVPVLSIHWVEADDHYLNLHGEDFRLIRRATMEATSRDLAPDFIRIHRKYLVNLHEIEAREKHKRSEYVILRSGEKLKVSRTYLQALENWSE